MRFREVALPLALFLVTIGCGGRESPTEPIDPGPPVAQSTSVSGNVYAERENNCPPDAVVEVLDGVKAGLRVLQDHKVCVEEGNGWFSFRIEGLTPGTPVKLRASAPGYGPLEKTVFPSGAVEVFVLSKQ